VLLPNDSLRAVNRAGARARWVERSLQDDKLPLPVLAAITDGHYLIVANLQGDRALVREPGADRSTFASLDDLRARCNGRVFLIVKCASVSDLGREFNLSWFLGAIARYRHMFAKVMIAPFFIQLKGPVTPTFFQVVQAAVCGKLRPGRIPVPTR